MRENIGDITIQTRVLNKGGILPVILLFCFLFYSTASAQNRYYLSQEWDDTAVPDDTTWAIEAVDQTACTMVTTDTAIVNSGSRSLKVVLVNPDKLYKRAEVAHKYHAEMGEQYFYRVSMYLPDPGFPQNNVDGSTFTIIAQWHAYPDFSLGETWRSPNLAFQMNEDGNLNVVLRYATDQVNDNTNTTRLSLNTVEIPKNQWVDFEVSVKWTHENDGYLDIWMDGTSIVNYTGPTSYNDYDGPYLKLGIYRTTWITEAETIYYDNLQIVKNGLIVFPDADTYVRGGSYENDNYGTSTSFIVKHNLSQLVYNREAYLHFDYSQFSEYDSDSGALYVQPYSVNSTADLYVDRVDNNWDENTLTYVSAQNLTTLAAEGSTACSSEPFEVEIPDAPNYDEISLHLYLDVVNAMIFHYSREYGTITMRPMLFLNLE